jgi:hypothetical protein
MVISSKPSSLLIISILCLTLSSKPPSLIIKNLALWYGLNEIGLLSESVATLTTSSEVAIKIEFL